MPDALDDFDVYSEPKTPAEELVKLIHQAYFPAYGGQKLSKVAARKILAAGWKKEKNG